MADYTTIENIRLFSSPDAGGMDQSGTEKAITAASRLFDLLAGVPADFFAAAPGAAVAKIIYSDGAGALRLPPFVGAIAAITDADGTVVQPTDYFMTSDGNVFYLRNKLRVKSTVGTLQLGSSSNYNYGVYSTANDFGSSAFYTVTARFGFAAVPADVESATTMLVFKLLRDTDYARAVMAGLEGGANVQDVPPLVQKTADLYRRKFAF